MVVVGLTPTDPEVGFEPTPLSIETEVAFVDVHVSVDDCPEVIAVGEAENVAVGAGCVTVTDAVLVIVPPGPVAVSVYVVVEVGLTPTDPERAWEPTPLSIEIEVVLVDVQVSVDDWPETIVVGEAENVAVGAAAPTVTVTCFDGGEAFAVVNALRV